MSTLVTPGPVINLQPTPYIDDTLNNVDHDAEEIVHEEDKGTDGQNDVVNNPINPERPRKRAKHARSEEGTKPAIKATADHTRKKNSTAQAKVASGTKPAAERPKPKPKPRPTATTTTTAMSTSTSTSTSTGTFTPSTHKVPVEQVSAEVSAANVCMQDSEKGKGRALTPALPETTSTVPSPSGDDHEDFEMQDVDDLSRALALSLASSQPGKAGSSSIASTPFTPSVTATPSAATASAAPSVPNSPIELSSDLSSSPHSPLLTLMDSPPNIPPTMETFPPSGLPPATIVLPQPDSEPALAISELAGKPNSVTHFICPFNKSTTGPHGGGHSSGPSHTMSSPSPKRKKPRPNVLDLISEENIPGGMMLPSIMDLPPDPLTYRTLKKSMHAPSKRK